MKTAFIVQYSTPTKNKIALSDWQEHEFKINAETWQEAKRKFNASHQFLGTWQVLDVIPVQPITKEV